MTRGGGMRPRLVVMIRRNGRVRGSSMLIWHAVGFGVDIVVVGEGYARFCVVRLCLLPPPPSLWQAMIGCGAAPTAAFGPRSVKFGLSDQKAVWVDGMRRITGPRPPWWAPSTPVGGWRGDGECGVSEHSTIRAHHGLPSPPWSHRVVGGRYHDTWSTSMRRRRRVVADGGELGTQTIPVGRPKMGVKLDLSASKCFNDMGPQGCRPREGGYRGAQNEEGERGGTRFSRSSRLGRQGPPSASPPLMAVILGYNAKFRVTDAAEGRDGRGWYPTSIAVPNGGVLVGPRTVVLSEGACVCAARNVPCRSRSRS